MSTSGTTFTRRMADARRTLSMGLDELAHLSGIAAETLQKWERGEGRPLAAWQTDRVLAVFAELNFPSSYFILTDEEATEVASGS